MTKKTDKLELNLDSGYGKDDSVENYKKIDDVLGLEGRTDDPDNPYPGERWFREDKGVIREAYVNSSGNINKVDKKTIYHVPSETIIEDFEGKTVSDLTTLGGGDVSVVEFEGSDRAKIDASAGGGVGGILVQEDNQYDLSATFYAEDDNGVLTVGFSDGSNVAYLAILDLGPLQAPSPSVGVVRSSTDSLKASAEIYPSNFVGGETDLRLYVNDSGGLVAEATGIDGTTTTATHDNPQDSIPTNDAYVSVVGGSADTTAYIDDMRVLVNDGQLSPALSHSDLADAPESAHHTQPIDEEQNFTISGSTEEATTVTLSQAYQSGIANCGFTSGTNISPANDADCYVQDYVTDADGNITDVVVYAHNTTGSSLDIDVRFFGVPA
jgi:hypothetical protein